MKLPHIILTMLADVTFAYTGYHDQVIDLSSFKYSNDIKTLLCHLLTTVETQPKTQRQ